MRLVDKIAYTIYDESSNIVSSSDGFVPSWNPDENENLVFTNLPENLVNGTYYIQLQLYYNDDLVGNVSLDYIKG